MMDFDDRKEHVRQMLQFIGENPDREGLIETPRRVVRAWEELFGGYKIDIDQFAVTFEEGYDQMVVLRGCEFYSHCEHHIMPFYGTVSIGYVSNGKVLGLSKLARISDAFARRLQVQERMTEQIAGAVEHLVHPKGVAVVVDGVHTCMSMRGANKQRSRMTTSAMRGVFRENMASRAEIMSLLRTRTEHE